MASARSEIGGRLPAVAAPPASPTTEKAAIEPPPGPPGDAHRSLPTPFLTKTYQLVDDPAVDDVISWNEDGSTFVVWRPAEFARDLLPKYFKHNNFSSFVRQLNTYGFRKIVPDRWEFANDCFRRGEKELLSDIHRRKVQTSAPAPAIPTAIPIAIPASVVVSPTSSADEQVVSPNSPPGAGPSTSGRGGGASTELVEENNRLRKENERLNHELSQMKSLCDNIVVLMSKYGTQLPPQHQPEDGGGCSPAVEDKSTPTPPPPPSPLELMPLMRCSGEPDRLEERVRPEERRSPSPRLFGVPIGMKRGRVIEAEDGPAGTSADDQPHPWRAMGVKPEPAEPAPDASPSPPDRSPHRHHAHQHRWRPYSSYLPNQRVYN
ncbi:hypothetical protein Taro_035796 [Colocasia esculenta]|uniref:HSF-type DNA-binding domain-containing protein n=1 Tax=Colocasia esculenta TaxID=4460 RepID=A0A843WFV0_COLES|nr:hypothetical protein [Colocasia esculenta]